MAHLEPPRVTVGVDTHKHVHVAAARDQLGRRLGTTTAPASRAGYAELLAWAHALGEVAAALLVTAGDNPQRLHSEAALAALCGASPVEASSGKTRRHRLNRGGDRQANAALHRIVIVRLRWHQPTRDYLARRTAEGKTKKESCAA
jgi:transposase